MLSNFGIKGIINHPSVFIMLSAELQHQAQQALQAYIDQASKHFLHQFRQPQLSYKLRGKCAGKAYLTRWEIRLNPVLFAENPQAFLNEVLPHEIAHLLTYQLFGKVKPHGVEWRSLMREVFHLQPKTTHSFDVSTVQGTGYAYLCQCQTHYLTIRRHNKVLKGSANYRCTRCQQELQFTGNVRT